LALIHYKIGNIKKSIELLQKSSTIDYHYPYTDFLISKIYQLKNKRNLAKDAFKRAKTKIAPLMSFQQKSSFLNSKIYRNGEVVVTGYISLKEVSLKIIFQTKKNTSLDDLPCCFQLLRTYQKEPFPFKSIEKCPNCGATPSRNTKLYEIHFENWNKIADQYQLYFSVMGELKGPMIHIDLDRIEIHHLSGAFSILPERWDWEYNLCIEFLTGINKRNYYCTENKNCILVPKSKYYQLNNIFTSQNEALSNSVKGQIDKAKKLWIEKIDAPQRSLPPVYIINLKNSHLCYASKDYIRFSSGALQTNIDNSLIYHEIGHYWWGINCQFSYQDRWFEELLAEYTIHLAAEKEGYLSDTRKNYIKFFEIELTPELFNKSLIHLAKSSDHNSQVALRIKGAFVISMLRKLMGTDSFFSALKIIFEYGQNNILTTYTVNSIFSYVYEKSLNWFFNQWIYQDGSIEISVDDIKVNKNKGSYKVDFLLSNHSSFLPGFTIIVNLYRHDKILQSINNSLNLGERKISIVLNQRPDRLLIDPHIDLFMIRKFREYDLTNNDKESVNDSAINRD